MTSTEPKPSPALPIVSSSEGGARTTLERVIAAGTIRRRGRRGAYRRLAYGPGEPRLVRRANAAPRALGPGANSLVRLVHFTDFQLADVQSPGRFEFFQEVYGRPGASAFVPAQRPQEALALHACEVMARTIRRLGESPDTGAALSLALCTGDNIDNAQANELAMFINLLSGGVVAPNSGGRTYQGVQAHSWRNPLYWHPDVGNDDFKAEWGFPEHPGLLKEAMARFARPGWACRGSLASETTTGSSLEPPSRPRRTGTWSLADGRRSDCLLGRTSSTGRQSFCRTPSTSSPDRLGG